MSRLFLLAWFAAAICRVGATCPQGTKCTTYDISTQFGTPAGCSVCFSVWDSDTLNTGGDLFAYSCAIAAQAADEVCSAAYDQCISAGEGNGVCATQVLKCSEAYTVIECQCTLDLCIPQLHQTTTSSSTSSSSSSTSSSTTTDSTSATSTPSATPTCVSQKRSPTTQCEHAHRACVNAADQKRDACKAEAAQVCDGVVSAQYKECLQDHTQKYCNRRVPEWVRQCATVQIGSCEQTRFSDVNICNLQEDACLQACSSSD